MSCYTRKKYEIIDIGLMHPEVGAARAPYRPASLTSACRRFLQAVSGRARSAILRAA
jgi:hypothetical protein